MQLEKDFDSASSVQILALADPLPSFFGSTEQNLTGFLQGYRRQGVWCPQNEANECCDFWEKQYLQHGL